MVVSTALGMLSFWSFDFSLLVKLFQDFLAQPSFFASTRRDIEASGRDEIIVSSLSKDLVANDRL